jgi:N4-(beta-N-acetylglucosaminyl)-L-asparaginase
MTSPIIVTSKTNHLVREEITNSGWKVLESGGSALDAAIEATNVSELSPLDTTVGYGGLPNEEGFLQLDASVMSGLHNNDAGAVGALQYVKTPSSVARLVMEKTDHLLLVGEGALKFAEANGFKREELLTDSARNDWEEWKRNPQRPGYIKQADKPEGGGTINVLAMDSNGDIAGVNSTVGHRYKLLSRVGDSAVIGAGLYVDNDVGAAAATGHGEAAIRMCASFLLVEKMREGLSCQAACVYVCSRIVTAFMNNPLFNLKMVALSKNGEFGSCSVRGQMIDGQLTGLGFCVHDEYGHRLVDGTAILPPLPDEEIVDLPLR